MPKVLQVAYGSGQFTKFKSQFKRGFTEMVLTRLGRLREWSKGELWRADNSPWEKWWCLKNSDRKAKKIGDLENRRETRLSINLYVDEKEKGELGRKESFDGLIIPDGITGWRADNSPSEKWWCLKNSDRKAKKIGDLENRRETRLSINLYVDRQ